MFGRKKKETKKKDDVLIGDGSGDIYSQAPRSIKYLFTIRRALSETDPIKVVLVIFAFFWMAIFSWTILLPYIGVIGDMPNKMPIMGGITTVAVVWWFSDIYHKQINDRVCVLSLDGRKVYIDNTKIDVLPRSERLYVVNSYGNPIYNTEEDDPRRYGKQKTISVPNEVREQFGSVRGMRALSYSDCKLTDIAMDSVDYSIFYYPRHVSEEKLLKENERMKLAMSVSNDTITKLKRDMMAVVKNIRGADKERLESLIEEMSGLKKAFYGGPEQLREMVRQEMYRPRSQIYNRYTPRRDSLTPSWSKYNVPQEKRGDKSEQK